MENEITYKDKGKGGIYIIRNIIDERIYIGSAKSLYGRYNDHKSNLKKNNHCNIKLQRFYNKYGKYSLQISILEYCNNYIEREQFYMDKLKPQFNIMKIAGSSLGHKPTKETRRKMSEAKKGKQTTGMLNKHHRPETKKLIRDKAIKRGIPEALRLASIKANTGSKHSKERIEQRANKQRKISNIQAVEIRMKLLQGVYQKILAKQYNVSQRVICRVKFGIGIYGEKDKDYYEAAQKRRTQHKAQLKLQLQ